LTHDVVLRTGHSLSAQGIWLAGGITGLHKKAAHYKARLNASDWSRFNVLKQYCTFVDLDSEDNEMRVQIGVHAT